MSPNSAVVKRAISSRPRYNRPNLERSPAAAPRPGSTSQPQARPSLLHRSKDEDRGHWRRLRDQRRPPAHVRSLDILLLCALCSLGGLKRVCTAEAEDFFPGLSLRLRVSAVNVLFLPAYNRSMSDRSTLLTGMGGEAGCRRLSEDFYARVKRDPVLRPFFPGKTLTCAIEEFSAFLIQFLGGDEAQTQRRWWLSLRASHDRFPIGPAERAAWLKQMRSTLDASPLDPAVRDILWDFFGRGASYVIGQDPTAPADADLAARWAVQRDLDAVAAAIAAGRVQEALVLTRPFAARPVLFIGLLARMIDSHRDDWTPFVLDAIDRDPSLATRLWAGRGSSITPPAPAAFPS